MTKHDDLTMHDGIVVPALILNAAAIVTAAFYGESIVTLGFVSGLGWCMSYRALRNQYMRHVATLTLHVVQLERAHVEPSRRITFHLDEDDIARLRACAKLDQ
jgi:hypothetical protein